jgi:hypothetical protein
MKNRTDPRQVRFPEPQCNDAIEPIELVFEEEDETPCSEYVVMSQESEMPALEEYLRERGARTIH